MYFLESDGYSTDYPRNNNNIIHLGARSHPRNSYRSFYRLCLRRNYSHQRYFRGLQQHHNSTSRGNDDCRLVIVPHMSNRHHRRENGQAHGKKRTQYRPRYPDCVLRSKLNMLEHRSHDRNGSPCNSYVHFGRLRTFEDSYGVIVRRTVRGIRYACRSRV